MSPLGARESGRTAKRLEGHVLTVFFVSGLMLLMHRGGAHYWGKGRGAGTNGSGTELQKFDPFLCACRQNLCIVTGGGVSVITRVFGKGGMS